MSKDRMKFPGKPGDQVQFMISGKLAKGDNLVQVATLLREETMAPISIVLLIYPGGMKFGSATSKKIPNKIMQELLKRLERTIQGYLGEPAEPENENGISAT